MRPSGSPVLSLVSVVIPFLHVMLCSAHGMLRHFIARNIPPNVISKKTLVGTSVYRAMKGFIILTGGCPIQAAWSAAF